MRGISLRVALALAVSSLIASSVAMDASAAEIRVISPGVISNSGLSDVAAAFEKKTGIKVTIQVDGMGTIMNDIRVKDPAADVVMLPMDLMGTMVLSGAVSDFTPLGRAEIGLFKKPDAPRPDITTVAKLIAAMRGASAVFYSDPVSGSMQAGMSDRLLKRPDFAGIHGVPVQGDAEPALKKGQGDANAMGLGLIHDPHNAANTETGSPWLVGELPAELGMHMDMATGISARSADKANAAAFIQFALSPGMRGVWRSKGIARY
ncbi:MAG TPA: extracellular solute-binding protein [Rhizomicrobium sp.]|nr:extracellular solute-binding protein [Rhizomicrobium sp.]